MLESAGDRFSGHVSARLQDRAVRRLPVLAVTLMEAALARWAANNWHAFDKREVNHTSQLYRWLVEAKRADSRYALLDVRTEDVVLTRLMLLGQESATTARRADVRIAVGEVGIHLEAKRLAAKGQWCHDYVHEGMARFVTSAYGSNETLGMMIGYVQQSKPDGLLQDVNSFVRDHVAMGDAHQLATAPDLNHGIWHASDHARVVDVAIRLVHVWVMV
jgi:hypothetical protein